MITTPEPKEKIPTELANLGFAAADLNRATDLLMVEIAGSAKWIEIILFVLRILRFLLAKLPATDTNAQAELDANGEQVADILKQVEELAKLKRTHHPVNRGGPCGET